MRYRWPNQALEPTPGAVSGEGLESVFCIVSCPSWLSFVVSPHPRLCAQSSSIWQTQHELQCVSDSQNLQGQRTETSGVSNVCWTHFMA